MIAYLAKPEEEWDAATATAATPIQVTDEVFFTVTAPSSVACNEQFLLDIWVHQGPNVDRILDRVSRASDRKHNVRSKGPFQLERHTVLTVVLSVPSLGIEQHDTILWTGEIENATFAIEVPKDAASKTHLGTATVLANGVVISSVHFEIVVRSERLGAGPDGKSTDMTTFEDRIRTAFASYATEDRDRIIARLQGIWKVLPDLDIFMDVLSLRSGELWERRLREEIRSRDIFYLFWSIAACKSEWVKREWTIALEEKGISYIYPVPLDSPKLAPPPTELSAKHFNEPILAFLSEKEATTS